jgi:signal peptidase II
MSAAALSRFFLTAVIGLAADLWTKSLAVSELKLPEGGSRTVDVIHGWLEFEFIQNPGAVFGIAPGKTTVFLIVSVIAVLFLTYLFSASAGKWFYQIILGMLMAGVLGNMYDRIEIGQVRDMIHALPGWRWPTGLVHALRHVISGMPDEVFPYIFNVADTLLCTGVGLMLLYSFFNSPEDEKVKRAATASA